MAKHTRETIQHIPGEPVPPSSPIRFLNPDCKNPSSAAWLGKKSTRCRTIENFLLGRATAQCVQQARNVKEGQTKDLGPKKVLVKEQP